MEDSRPGERETPSSIDVRRLGTFRDLVIILALLCLPAFVCRGGFMHWVLASMVLFLVLAPALLAVVFFVIRDWSEGSLSRPGLAVIVVASAALAIVISAPVGSILLKHDIKRAMAHCESLVPELDEHKRAHGRYPKSLESLSPAWWRRPRLLRPSVLEYFAARVAGNNPQYHHGGHNFYSGGGDEFRFTLIDPAGFMNGWRFSSTDRRWREWH